MRNRLLILIFIAAFSLLFGCGGGGSSAGGGDDTGDDTGGVTGSDASDVTVIIEGETVSWTAPVVVEFSDAISEPADWNSVLTLTQVDGDGTNLCPSGVITFADNTLTCTPASGLSRCERYTVKVTGLLDADGKEIPETTKTLSVMRVNGDVNGDGYADAIVGAPSGAGSAYIYYGAASGMSATVAVTYSDPVVNGNFGSAVSSHGDFNGDCIADALVTAPYHTDHGADKAYVYFGSANLSSSDAPDVTFADGGGTDDFGFVASAGDFNGDGFDDAIIGAPMYDSSKGRVYIYNGSANMDATADKTIDSPGGTSFGISVAAGDFNNDGYDDAIVGQNYDMSVHIFYGSASGLGNESDVVLGYATPAGETASFGYAVASGNFNGDDFEDVLVGNDFGGSGIPGKVHIFYGSATGVDTTDDVVITGSTAGGRLGYKISSGDFNGDGFDDVIAKDNYGAYIYFGAEDMDATADVSFTGTSPGSVSSGDFDADGFADAILGYFPTSASTGIFYGSANMTGAPSVDVTLGKGGSAAGGASP